MYYKTFFSAIFAILMTTFIIFNVSQARAGIITFELDANGNSPTDNGVVEFTDVFFDGDVGISFGFDTDNDGVLDQNAVFEAAGNNDTGDNDTGFKGGYGDDMAAPNYVSQLGQFFLRQSTPYSQFGIFTILYDSELPITAASGEIWDIDGKLKNNKTEQFLVEAFNGDTLLDSIMSPLGIDHSLDAKPWAFGFSNLTDINKIEISFVGGKKAGIGLAFNNFSPVQNLSSSVNVNEPTTLYLMLIAATFLFIHSRKKVWCRAK
jgi:hypothetical protein